MFQFPDWPKTFVKLCLSGTLGGWPEWHKQVPLGFPPTCANVGRNGKAIKYQYVQGIENLRRLEGGNTLEQPASLL